MVFTDFSILGSPGGYLRAIQGIHLLMADIPHHKEAICAKRKKVTEQFLRNFGKCVKIAPGGYLGGSWEALGGFNKKTKKIVLSFDLDLVGGVYQVLGYGILVKQKGI